MKQRTLKASLEAHPLALLRALATAHGLEPDRPTAAAYVDALTAHLSRAETVAALLERLHERTHATLNLLLAHGGQMPSHRLQRDPVGGELRQLGTGALERLKPWEAPLSSTEELYYTGLIYQDFGVIGDYRGQVLYVPTELMELLPPVEAPTVAFEVAPLEGMPPGLREGTLNLVQDAFVVLSDVQRRTIHSVQGKYFPAEALHRINARLTVPESPDVLNHERESQRLAFLLHLLRTLNLIESRPDGVFALVNPRVRRWLELPKAQRLKSLQRVWADDNGWNDLWRVPTLRPEATGWRNDPRIARLAFLKRLKELAPDTWYSVADVVRAMKRGDPDFQRPDGDYNSWYIRHATSNQFLHGWENWEHVEGALLRYYFSGPLYWLGAVDLGYLAPGERQPFAFKLTAFGARWLGHEVTVPPEAERAPLIIAADGTVNVPAGAADWEKLHLERLSEPLENGDYKLTRDHVLNVMVEGGDIERVIRFLDHAGNGYLPDAVATQLRKWAEGYGHVTLERCLVLEVDDPKRLRDIQRQPHLARYIIRTLGPKAVVVPAHLQEQIVAELRQAGYLPRVVTESDG